MAPVSGMIKKIKAICCEWHIIDHLEVYKTLMK